MNVLQNTRIIMFLIFVCLSVAVLARKGSRKGNRYAPCTRGCTRCDDTNGCVQCRSRMFLYISNNRGNEFGDCKHECPTGYFGLRGRPVNKCLKCEVQNCKSCFTSKYCTTCQSNFYLHAAKCVEECPKGLIANPATGKCEDKVDCVVSPWSTWSKCTRRSASRSCKYGRKKRTRLIVQEPTENGKECPRLKEGKKCKTPSTECILINKVIQRMKNREKKRKRKTRKRTKRKHRKIHDNSTYPRLSSRPREKYYNMTSLIGQTER